MKTNHSTQNYTVWNLPKGAKARIGDGYIIGKIVYAPDGTQLVVPKSSGIWVYDASTLEVVDMIGEHNAFNSVEIRSDQRCKLIEIEVDNAVSFSSKGNLFGVRVTRPKFQAATSGNIYTIRIWSRKIEQPERISIECPDSIDFMVLSPDGSTLAGSKNGTIYLWNVHTGNLQNTLIVKGEKIKSIVFSPDGSTLAGSNSSSRGVFGISRDVFDSKTFESTNLDVNVWEFNTRPGISPDGETYEWTNFDVNVWDTRTGRHKFIQNQATAPVVFSPDGLTLANRTADGWVIVLSDVETGIQKFCLEDYAYSSYFNANMPIPIGATSLAFSPDGHILASFSTNKIQLWDLRTGNCKSTFTGTGNITSLVFSPDGFTLAGGCEDGTVLLWDIDSSIGETALTDDNRFIIPESNIDSDINGTVLKKKDTEFQNRASQIQRFCEERGITTLVHFTQIEHLWNILHEGLLDHQGLLEKHGQQFDPNDKQRRDGHKEAVCLSISFPNYKMLWDIRKKKEKTEGITDSQWIVLLLDAKVLWELDCAFCQTNAASGAVIPLLSDERIGEQKRPEALEDMFADNFYASKRKIWIRRQNLQIPKHYTTDPQAEVLVFDPISAKYINEVHFYDDTALQTWLKDNPSTYSQRFYANQQYLKPRHDYKAWQNQ